MSKQPDSKTHDITVAPDIQIPHMAKMATADTQHLHSNSPLFTTSRTTDHFRRLAVSSSPPVAVPPPADWDSSLTSFLSKLCSPYQMALENLAIWQTDISRIKVPTTQTREQWQTTTNYINYLTQQIAINNPQTGNFHQAMFHYLVNMRCLKTVDFSSEPLDPALLVLQFIIRLVWRSPSLLQTNNDKVQSLLIDHRPVASGTLDLIVDKASALEDGQIRAHAIKQTMADPNKLYIQMLHFTVLAIDRLDVGQSESACVFYQGLVGMLTDIFVSQVTGGSNILMGELLETVAVAKSFSVEYNQAEALVLSLLVKAIDSPSACPSPSSSGAGLVHSAYSYLFARQTTSASKGLEQRSLLLLLLLVSQPTTKNDNPFWLALMGLRDANGSRQSGFNRDTVSFIRLFDKIIKEIAHLEWAALLQILVAGNESFRTYVLARTDADTLISPLLRYIRLATTHISSATTKTTTEDINIGGILRQGAALPYTITLDSIPYIHLYLWLDVLLTLCADHQFIQQLQRAQIITIIGEQTTATTASSARQPLSHTIILEALRIFQLNLKTVRDQQLHLLSMGILVNVLSHTTSGVTTAISQKLLKFYEMIYKRYNKITTNGSEHQVYSQILQILLTLFCRLANTNNPQFIYALMQARESLLVLPPNLCRMLVDELQIRVAYFHARMTELPNKSNLQARDILELIERVLASEKTSLADNWRAEFVSQVDRECRERFLLPMVWELWLSSDIATIRRPPKGCVRLLDEFSQKSLVVIKQ